MKLEIRRGNEIINTFRNPEFITKSFINNLWARVCKAETVKRFSYSNYGGEEIRINFTLKDGCVYSYIMPSSWGGYLNTDNIMNQAINTDGEFIC